MKTILFVCVQNAGRSQMAKAFLEKLGGGRVRALSAGTMPAEAVNPVVICAMGEVGIDISAEKPQLLTSDLMSGADRIVTMGCGAEGVCPATFVPTDDWGLDDPQGQPLEAVRAIREQIEARVRQLLEDEFSAGQRDPSLPRT